MAATRQDAWLAWDLVAVSLVTAGCCGRGTGLPDRQPGGGWPNLCELLAGAEVAES